MKFVLVVVYSWLSIIKIAIRVALDQIDIVIRTKRSHFILFCYYSNLSRVLALIQHK